MRVKDEGEELFTYLLVSSESNSHLSRHSLLVEWHKNQTRERAVLLFADPRSELLTLYKMNILPETCAAAFTLYFPPSLLSS